MDVAPSQVWQVISDPYAYAQWVVGAKEIRAFEGEWPARGALLHHTVGTAIANMKDNTEVLDVDPMRRIKLRGRVRPLGLADITFLITEVDGRTSVTVEETVSGGPAKRIPKPVLDAMLKLRNAETLRRLENLAARRPRQS